jgi:hypothetical protein
LKLAIHRTQQTHQFNIRALLQLVSRPGGVFAGAPGNDGLLFHKGMALCVFSRAMAHMVALEQ